MIRSLRKKIIAINVISVGLVFLTAIIVVFAMGYTRIESERINRLKDLINQEYFGSDEPIPDGMIVAEYDTETDTILWGSIGYKVHLPEQYMPRIIERVVSKRNSNGSVALIALYAKSTVNGTVRIAILDKTTNVGATVKYVLYTLLALFLGPVSYIVTSIILARIALSSVEESWDKQKQFVADASHELKTPLAVIMANTELIASHGDETVNSQMQWINNTREESERMAELVNDLLFLAKNDDGAEIPMDTVDLSECIETTVLSHEVLLYEAGKTFSYHITPNIAVTGNVGQLKQLATILLANANKYSTGAGNINLEVNTVGKYAVLTIANDCEQITDEQLKHLFDRFYTVDQSRNNSGNGLGLAIAQAICQTHRGDIKVDYADGRVTFVATLPLYKDK